MRPLLLFVVVLFWDWGGFGVRLNNSNDGSWFTFCFFAGEFMKEKPVLLELSLLLV